MSLSCLREGSGSDRMAAFGFEDEGRVGCVSPPPAVQKPLSFPGSPPSMSPEGLAAIQELM